MKKFLLSLALIKSINILGQDSSSSGPLKFNAFLEIYNSYDFNKPVNDNRPAFFYSHNRHNEFNLNLGFLKVSYNTDKVRANLALAAGTYIHANYAAEPGVLKNIFKLQHFFITNQFYILYRLINKRHMFYHHITFFQAEGTFITLSQVFKKKIRVKQNALL